jgi:hypothetical protein
MAMKIWLKSCIPNACLGIKSPQNPKSYQPNYRDERKMGVTSAGEFEIDHSLFIDNALSSSSV